jgi:hypothetical protein
MGMAAHAAAGRRAETDKVVRSAKKTALPAKAHGRIWCILRA